MFKRAVGYVICLALFGLTGGMGIRQGPGDFADASTSLQKISAGATTLYGLFGVIAALGLALSKSWSAPTTAVWGAALVVAALAAPPAWAPGETPWWAVLLGGLVTAGLVFAVLRIVRSLLRQERANVADS